MWQNLLEPADFSVTLNFQQPQHENQQPLSQVPGPDPNAQVGKPIVGRDSCVLEHDQTIQYTGCSFGDSLNAATLIWNHIKSLCRNISAWTSKNVILPSGFVWKIIGFQPPPARTNIVASFLFPIKWRKLLVYNPWKNLWWQSMFSGKIWWSSEIATFRTSIEQEWCENGNGKTASWWVWWN